MLKEVKRTSKKALSVLLAIIMIMSSMSVCFGTFTFSASAAYEEYTGGYTKLIEYAESDIIAKYTGTSASVSDRIRTTTLTAANYADYVHLRDTLIYLYNVMLKTDEYTKTFSSSDNNAGKCTTITGIGNEIINKYKEINGSISSSAEKFLKYVISGEKEVAHPGSTTRLNSTANKTVTNTLTIKVNDVKGYVKTIDGDYTTVGDAEKEITFSITSSSYDGSTELKFSYVTGQDSCGKDQTSTYYHHYIWNKNGNYLESNPPKVTSTDSSAKTTINAYVTYVNNFLAKNTFDAMAVMSTAEIEALKSQIGIETNTIKAYLSDEGEGKQDEVYDQFYPGFADRISAWETTADDAEKIAIYSGDADALATYMNSVDYGTFQWGAFDEATIRADYATFTTTYKSLLENTTVYSYFVQQGIINDAAVKNFRDNVVVYDLEDTKEAADALYAKYKDGGAIAPDLDGEEENPIQPEVDLGLLTGYINAYNGYTAQVKNAIFPDGIEYLLKLQEEFECTVSECVVYFAEHAYLDYTDAKTDAVIAEIETAKKQLEALNALRASVNYNENLGLLDLPFELAAEFIEYLYSLLAERFALQVVNADAAYTEIGRPTKNLTLEQFSKVNGAMSAVEDKILDFLDAEGQSAKISSETRALFAALETNFEPAYNSFKQDRAFDLYTPSTILIRREDNSLEYFRKNADLDNDGVGEYEVTEENVMDIINLLEGALKDPTVAKLLGDLINKDEDGNPTGEAFDLANLINGLLEKIYTDDLLNTIISFLYPIIGKAFADVWAGLPSDFTTTAPTDMGDALVKSKLVLDDVDTAIGNVGIAISPLKLAEKLTKDATYKTKYRNVINALYAVNTVTGFDADGNYIDPWQDKALFKDKTDADGKVVIDESTGKAKQVYKLEWGITDRASFIDAACAALSGLEPLLYALLLNQSFVNANTTGRTDVRGCKIGVSGSGATATVNVSIVGDVVCALTLDPITLMFQVSANDGYSNVLAPIFEVLGLENIPKSSDLKNTKDFLEKGLFAMIDQLIAKVAADPIETILGLVPNLVYALEADLVAPLLDLLEIEIYYEADAAYSADIPSSVDWITGVLGVDDPVLGSVQGAMKAEKEVDGTKVPDPILINVGQMIDLKSMGVNLSGGLKGILDLVGIELPELDTGFLAKAGELTWKSSNRTRYTYTYMPTGATKMQAAYIDANKADVLVYLVKWAFANLGELLATFGVDTSSMGELVATIFDNLAANSHDAVAALVELLNQKSYDAKTYTWFNGEVDGESVVGNSAYEIYLNPENDWTKEKAEYLYNNLEAILEAVFVMAGLDLDKNADGVQTDLGDFLGGAVNGLLTDETLTSLATLLAKLDLNALLAKDDTAAEEGEEATPETPETVAEGEEEAAASAIDVNALVKSLLGIDLAAIAAQYAPIAEAAAAAKEAGEEYVYNFGVNEGTKTFAAALAEMLAPLSVVLDFILEGGNLEITLGDEKATLIGADGYNNAIVPLLEALGCDAKALGADDTALEATINALVAKIDALTKGDVVKGVIDMLPGLLYFIASNGLATAVMNLLQPVLVIVDTIRPIFDVMGLINGIEIGEADENGVKKTIADLLGGELNLRKLDVNFIFNLLPAFIDLDLTGLKHVIYDVCNEVGTTYTSASTLIGKNGKKGAYTTDFDQADLLTLVLSFVLDWATVKENAEALDEMLGTNGIIASLDKVFADVEITYGTPNWSYVFPNKGEFDEYLASTDGKLIDKTLDALDYPNDWNSDLAQYFADNLSNLIDIVIAMLNKDKADAPKSLEDMLKGLVYGDFGLTIGEGEEAIVINYLFSDETINALIGMLKNVLANVDDALLGAGLLLDVDLVGLKNYKCEKEITTISGFVTELAYVLDTYAPTLVNLLFFGDDIRLAAKEGEKGEKVDTIVINGGLGYEKGLALILEALGCAVPAADKATTANVLAALAARVEAILADPVDEIIATLPNLVYFLNADGATVAVNNILAPVYAILDKINVILGEEKAINLADLLGFDLKDLSFGAILTLVEEKTGLDLSAAKSILVNLCYGKLVKTTYGHKMVTDAKDTITIILTTAFSLLADEDFSAKLAEMTGVEVLAAINNVFAYSNIEYVDPNWLYCADENGEAAGGSIPVIESALTYPNNWNKEAADYIINNLPALVDTVIGMIKINETEYASLAALLQDVLADTNVYSTEVLQSLIDMLAVLLKDIDDELLGLGVIVDVDIVGLKNHKVSEIVATKDKTVAQVFAAEVAEILGYANGIVEWLLFGRDFKFFVTEEAKNNGMYDIIALTGANGYAEGLALILEALGCEDLPTEGTTEEIVAGVLDSLARRIDAIIANPVEEILALLPNLIYFINANGLAVAINNLAAAPIALLAKLSAFGIEGDINKLINIEKLLGVEKDLAIGVNNLTLEAILELVEELTGLDLTVLKDVLAKFALGELQAYTSVSGKTAYKMAYKDEFGRHDMITVVLTAVFATVFGTEGNAAALDALLGTEIITAIEDVFNPADLEYGNLNYTYPEFENGEFPGDVIDTNLTVYPTGWTEEKAEWLITNLPELADAIVSLIEINGVKYESLSALLTANVNVFTAENLKKVIDLIANLLGGIDEGLLEAAGLLLNVDVVGLKNHAVNEDIDTAAEFAAELATILNTYAKGLVEWLFLGKDYRFFVKGVDENNLPVDFITIQGTQGYTEALALLLEALGCENLPTTGTTEEIVNGVFASLAARIDAIFANPVEEVIELLPGLIYFLNADGAAVVVKNLTAGITALLDKLSVFGLNIDINSLIDLKKTLGVEKTDISLENLSLATIIDVVAEITGLNLDAVKAVFVDYQLGAVEAYDSVSANEQYTMVYADDADRAKMLTAVLVAVLMTAFDEEIGNREALKGMISEDIIVAIESIINGGMVVYGEPNWFYCVDATTGKVIETALEYPNDWNKEAVTALTNNLPELVDAVIAMINTDENAPKTLAALLQGVLADANIFTTETLQGLIDMIAELLGGIDEGLLDAGILVDVDINGLKKHKVTDGIATVDAFAAELALILNTYAKGIVEWLLLGQELTFFFKDYDEKNNPEAYITISGGHGYAKAIALVLEALGCENLPEVFAKDADGNFIMETDETGTFEYNAELDIDSAAIVDGVFASIAARIDAIIANPVGEVLDVLPNIIYFLNTNGVATVVSNLLAPVTTLLGKLAAFGIKLDINELVNIEKLCGIDKDLAISLNNLTLAAILELVGELVGLDLTVLEKDLGGFALGTVAAYDSVSGAAAYKMSFARADMVTVLLTSVISTVFNGGMNDNAEKLADMLGIKLLTAIEDAFNSIAPEYGVPNWKYVLGDNTSLDAVIHQIQNPNNWTAEDAAYLAEELPGAVDMIVRQLSDAENLSELLAGVLADTNIFTTATIQSIVDMLAGLLEDIDEGLVGTAGLFIDVDVVGLKKHNVTEGIDTIGEFAAELATILNTYAKGLVEWLLLGRDFKFLVHSYKNYETPVEFITINGAQGYAEGLALILEALGCENLPAANLSTEEIVAGVLASLAARIDAIIADPVNEIVDLLPNLLYFINTNGLAVAVNNTIAAITALLDKLAILGVDLDLNELVNLKKLLGLPEDALISLDCLTVEALLQIVEYKVPELSLTHIKNILVNFALGQLVEYDSVSGKDAYKMIYRDADKAVADGYTAKYMIDKGEMYTVIANAAIMVLEDEDNLNFFWDLLGEKIMTVILSLFNFDEPQAKDFEWLYVNPDGSYDADKIYSGFSASENYDKNAVYGEFYTKEQAEYIATNFPDFVDNMIYLIGVDTNGDGINEEGLKSVVDGLLGGGLYNSDNVKKIQKALYDVINNALMGIKIGSGEDAASLGVYIKMILKLSKIADIEGIKNVEIAEFSQDKDAFVAAICDILEPIAPVLRFVLADEDFRFFTTYDEVTGKPTDAITIRGAEGYAYGIIPLLEVLGCNQADILTPDEYYATVKSGDNTVLLTSILNPLLKRVDAILANPADEVLNMLPNLIYFINSKGLDTVVKNTLSAVFALLNAIKPIKEIDLYAAVEGATGLNLETVDFKALVEFALNLLNKSGYSFTVSDLDAFADLAVGKLEAYESRNGKTAYRMVYVDGVTGGKTEMVNIIEGLIITFLTDEKNQATVVKFLEEKLGMGETGKEFVEGTIEVLAGALKTDLGMQAALAAVYYIYYGLDVGADSTVGGLNDINKIWSESLKDFKENVPGMDKIIDSVLGLEILEDIVDQNAIAPKGFAKFIAKITGFFQNIANFFKNLFSFGK